MGLPEFCSFCGSAQDAYGDHVLCCKAAGVYSRHNALRDTVADLLRECGCETRTEFPLPDTKLRPADVYTPAFPGESALAVDVSVVHPLQPSQNATATVTAGAAAQKREAAKVKLYDELCSRRAWGFTAFVGETTGAWGQAAQRCMRALVRAKCLRTGEDQQEVAHTAWDAVCHAVAFSVARQLVRARVGCGMTAVRPPPARGSSSRSRQPQGAQGGGGEAPTGRPTVMCGPQAGDLLLACALCQ